MKKRTLFPLHRTCWKIFCGMGVLYVDMIGVRNGRNQKVKNIKEGRKRITKASGMRGERVCEILNI